MTTPLIKEGHRSEEVADVQARLRSLGFSIDDEPTLFGASTRQAVREFQQRRGLLVDGIVGPNTWTELVEASWRLGDRALYLKQRFQRGDDVRMLQTRLNALGFDAGREDGIFGPAADRAVRGFQKEYGIEEDGIFGIKSYAALVGLRVDRPGTARQLREELLRTQGPQLERATVVLDPGHGGQDSGEQGNAGAEADLCWRLCTRIAEKLILAGAHVRLTRTEASGPESSDRARLANELDADLFVSLHLNHHDEPTAEGASTYYFDGSRAGEALAESVQHRLVDLGLKDCRSHARSYTLLRETAMPAVLVEPLFLSNPDEQKLLEDPEFLGALADAIARGIKDYLEGS
jgi:N-acetylmuramoyl-L-alanine amidase